MVILHDRLWNKIFTTLPLSGTMVDTTQECMKGMFAYIGQEISGMSQAMLDITKYAIYWNVSYCKLQINTVAIKENR